MWTIDPLARRVTPREDALRDRASVTRS